ncbi:signal peptidase II [Buchnera aphidicola (Hyperomyzus lactucae)]|uniref:Lipoprotein signal peptidase n=1 Tax=Buchnera aphidicola (Hyperomyzus lactucae) TaxID=1241860 RepID=A0A4D6Y9A9_9GAMM|nr:signal peptidase II [Buchnera aphidicola]QCI20885.1 signal peptidase II [Buchnera aphidicola (Hyperomyzus lactucae)]
MKNQYFKKNNKWIYISIIIFIVIIDIFSKDWIVKNIKPNEIREICLILNFFHIHNYGAAFSILSDQTGWQRWFLSIVSISTILVIIRMIINSNKKETKKITAYCLIIAGAMGNLIDRISYGFVIDFIDVHLNDWHFATFNIADCSIFIGIILFTQMNY